jgi:hypothetical protein
MSKIRCNPDGTVDEVIALGAVHIEQLDDNQWWLCIDEKGGRTSVVFSARGKIKVHVSRD